MFALSQKFYKFGKVPLYLRWIRGNLGDVYRYDQISLAGYCSKDSEFNICNNCCKCTDDS